MDTNNQRPKIKDGFLPIHLITKDQSGKVVNKRNSIFQINAGESYNISYKFFIPKNTHLEANTTPTYNCKLINGKLNIPQITFTYVKNGIPASQVSHVKKQTNQNQFQPNNQPTQPIPGKPVIISYFDVKTGKTIKKYDLLHGNIGDKINILNRIKLPKGYVLQKMSKISVTINNKIQTVSLFFKKNPIPKSSANFQNSAMNRASQNSQQPSQPSMSQNVPKSSATITSNKSSHVNVIQKRSTDPHNDIFTRLNSQINRYNNQLRNKLLSQVISHDMKIFKKVLFLLLTKLGYTNVDNIQSHANNHLSGLSESHLFGNVYICGCKYDSNRLVTIGEIREFVTSVMDHNASKGIFITTSHFNSDAQKEAKMHNITIIDGNELSKLMMKYSVGIGTLHNYKIVKFDSQFFND